MKFSKSVLLALGVSMLVSSASANSCWECPTETSPVADCITCAGKALVGDELEVVVDFEGCKDDAISWGCCTGSDGAAGACEAVKCCDGVSCSGPPDANRPKCETVTSMKVRVPSDATSITINTHDGQTVNEAGALANEVCGGPGGPFNQGGGCSKDVSGATSHCVVVIDLATCPTSAPTASPTVDAGDEGPQCDGIETCIDIGPCMTAVSVDQDTCLCNYEFANEGQPCGNPDFAGGLCDAQDICESGVCVDKFIAQGTVCRAAAADGCDIEDVCDGSSKGCPDVREPDNTPCGNPDFAGGLCDAQDICESGVCVDKFIAQGTVCRGEKQGSSCDVAEECDGTSKECPIDAFKSDDVVCRGVLEGNVCDKEEKCTGSGPDCPVDAKFGSEKTCREAAGDCDIAEVCDGSSDTCPDDKIRPNDYVCRERAFDCDIEEKCDGEVKQCPCDSARNDGYTLKCGTYIYVCGVDVEELTQGKGKQMRFGDQTIGSAKEIKDLNKMMVRLYVCS